MIWHKNHMDLLAWQNHYHSCCKVPFFLLIIHRKRFRAYYMYFGVTYMKTKTNFIPWMTAAHAQTSKIQSLWRRKIWMLTSKSLKMTLSGNKKSSTLSYFWIFLQNKAAEHLWNVKNKQRNKELLYFLRLFQHVFLFLYSRKTILIKNNLMVFL